MPVMRKFGNALADIATLGGHGAAAAAKRGAKEQLKTIAQGQADIRTQRDRDLASIAEATDPFTRSASGDWEAYRGAAGQDLSQYNYDPFEEYNTEDTKKYLDPSIDYQVQQATRGVEGSAANAGKLNSGATLKAIADRAQQIGQTGYQNAQNTGMDVWRNRMQYGQAAKNQGLGIAQQGLQNLQGVAQQGYNATQAGLGNTLNTNQAYNQQANNLLMQQGNIQAQKAQIPGGMTQFMNALPQWVNMGAKVYSTMNPETKAAG